MTKLMFILQRRNGTSVEEMQARWSSDAHVAKVKQLPGLVKFVQNHVVASPAGHVCDGVGELWFDSRDALERALSSPEMAAAFESAQSFLDMERTGMVIVQEHPT